jgi:hypothetical protein
VSSCNSASAEKATECDNNPDDCYITITLRLAFVGAEATDSYIINAVDEIQDEWSGSDGSPSTYGDCKCIFRVKVDWKRVQDCDSAGNYHCIEVTDYNTNPPYSANESILEEVKKGNIDPKTSDLVERHRGYMKGTSTGAAIKGWWSDIMSTDTEDGERCIDFAHEAGHMMGLNDGDGGIMDKSGTYGANAGVTQQNIDDVVEKVCGKNVCPDRCCCGNRKIDRNKGEKCDPLATPSGCEAGKSCCPVCCNCFVPVCVPKNGEFISREDCEKNCKEEEMVCLMNYYTGCWDCVEHGWAGFGGYSNTTEAMWKANESIFHGKNGENETVSKINRLLEEVGAMPFISRMVANERINFNLGQEVYHAITVDGEVDEAGEGEVSNPSVRVFTDTGTLNAIINGEITVEGAYRDGKIKIKGVGFFNSLKLGVVNSLFGLYSFFSDLF